MVDTLAAYSWSEDNSEHVLYIDNDRHIHELWLIRGSGQWQHTDLTAAARAPEASADSKLLGFVWPEDHSEHAIYVGSDGHLHQLWYLRGTERWQHTDLNNEATNSPVPPATNTSLTHAVGSQFESIFYIGNDNRLHQLSYSVDAKYGESYRKWYHTDVTTQANAMAITPNSPLVGIVSPNYSEQPSERVFYVGTDQHIHEVFFSWLGRGTGWRYADLTTQLRLPLAAQNSGLTGYVWLEDNSENIFFVDTNNEPQHLKYSQELRKWAHGYVLTGTGAPLAKTGSPLTSFAFQNIENIFYIDGENSIIQLQYKRSQDWKYANLKRIAGAVSAITSCPLASYAWQENYTQHIFYLGEDRRIRELYALIDTQQWNHADVQAMAQALAF